MDGRPSREGRLFFVGKVGPFAMGFPRRHVGAARIPHVETWHCHVSMFMSSTLWFFLKRCRRFECETRQCRVSTAMFHVSHHGVEQAFKACAEPSDPHGFSPCGH